MLLPSSASGICVSVEEDEVFGGNCLLWVGVEEILIVGEEPDWLL